MSITLEEAQNLRTGEILLDERGKRWKVNGRVKSWVRNPNRIRVPLKHGLYAYDAITEADFDPTGVCTLLTKES